MRHATMFVAILAFVPLASATAQVPIRPGARVRVTRPPLCASNTRCVKWPRQSVGTVLAWDADSLVVQSNGNSLALPLDSVTKLEVSQGKKSFTLEGAVLGLLGGGVLGVLAEISAGHEKEKGKKICKLFIGDILVETGRPSEISCREEPGTPETWGSPSWRGATIGAVLGAIAGGLIGGSMSDRWQEIPLEQVRVRVTKRRDGRFALGASVRF